MSEKWILKTEDGAVYNLNTEFMHEENPNFPSYYSRYDLLKGVTGHHGMPVSYTSDVVPYIAGAEKRQMQRGVRTVYLPIRICGTDEADFHKNFSRIRQSLRPENEIELWVTNKEGRTRVLYCQYSKGFESVVDDWNKGPNWQKVPLYVEAFDPYWYDAPGSEISRNFSSSPWSENFFTFTHSVGLAQDAHIGDTQIALTNTANCIPSKAVEIRGAKYTIEDDYTFDPNMVPDPEDNPFGNQIVETNVTVAINVETPAANQPVVVSGKLTAQTQTSAVAQSNQQVNVQVANITQIQSTGAITGSGNTINYGSQSISQISSQSNISLSDVNISNVKILSTLTDIFGKWEVPIKLEDEGRYHITALFEGDDYRLPSTAVKAVTVGTVAPTTLSLTSSSGNPLAAASFNLKGKLTAVTSHTDSVVMDYDDALHLGYIPGAGTTTKNKLGGTTLTTPQGIWSYRSLTKHSGRWDIFTLYGTPAGDNPVPNQTITLYKAHPNGKIKIGTATTNASGEYSLAITEPRDGWVHYEAVYAGDAAKNVASVDTKTQSWAESISRDYGTFFNDLFDSVFGWMGDFFNIGKTTTRRQAYAAGDVKLLLKIGTPNYPISYQAALTPSQVNDGEIQYFGNKQFGSILLIAEAITDDYSEEYDLIIAQGFTAAIDISLVTDKIADLTIGSATHTWLHSLYTAGWRYVSGINTTGRAGDPAYLNSHFGFLYINYNPYPRGDVATQPDISGTGVDHNSFKCWNTNTVSYIQSFTTAAFNATPSKLSGLTSIVWPSDDKGLNQMLINSVAKLTPTFRDLLDWSYQEEVGMNNFVVWFHPTTQATGPRNIVAEQISLYKELGFEAMIADMMLTYPSDRAAPWTEPALKATYLTFEFSGIPLVISGTLSKRIDDTPIEGKTISLQEDAAALLTATATIGTHTVTLDSVDGFVVGGTVTISSSDPYSESNVIDAIDRDTKVITVHNALAYNYTVAKASAMYYDWIERLTGVTDSDGEYSITYDDLGAGMHNFRTVFVADGTYLGSIAPSPDGELLYHAVKTVVTQVLEDNIIDSVDSPTLLTLKTPLVNDYLVKYEAYLTEVDHVDKFLTSAEKTLNQDCELVIFWMRQCPPCYAAKAQLAALKAYWNTKFLNIDITYVETQDNEADPTTRIVADRYEPITGKLLFAAHSAYDELGNLNIGMDTAALRYPDAYAFAQACGPPLPTGYHAIGNMMPAVIALYRDDLYIKAWCGVHTTGQDPVSTEIIEETCGPKLTWRFGESSLAKRVAITNASDNVAYPVWTLMGPARTPTLTNVTTGDIFQLNHDLAEGEMVVIDATETEHTCAGTAVAGFAGGGYVRADKCPTCKGTGIIPAACEGCGGTQICPTCHGSGVVSTWVDASAATTTNVGGLFNLRYLIDTDNRFFWGLEPGTNIVKIEMGAAKYGKSMANMKLVQRYEGI
jgi:hypothetical protein